MGLQKPMQLSSGASANYWKLQGIELLFDATQATIHYMVFKDKETRDRPGAEPVRRSSVGVTGKEFLEFFPRDSEASAMALAYNCLKKKVPQLRDAEEA